MKIKENKTKQTNTTKTKPKQKKQQCQLCAHLDPISGLLTIYSFTPELLLN